METSPRRSTWMGPATSAAISRSDVPRRDGRVADAWGRLGAVRPVPVIDGLLAATARVHDMTLVTRNEPDVEGLGVPVLNPFGA